ncbi:MAG TPA: PorV/PorQ family protein [Bacteroidia bacterium]|nr:PorV/PorQ family protein [Bacteroidia bacterium]
MSKQKIFLAAIFFFGSALTSFSQAVKYSNEFLSIGVSARAQGLGGSVVAQVNDVTAGYWNPAGLVLKQGDLQIGLQHAELFAGILKYDYGAICAPIDATRAVGLSIIRLAVDDIPDTTELLDADGNVDYNRIKSFSSADYGFIFTYSKKTKKEGLRYGANAKVIHRKAGEFASAWGFGLDAGIQYQKNKWTFGVMGRDITSTFNAWKFNTDKLATVFAQTGNEIPQNGVEVTLPKLIPGAAYSFKLGKKFNLITELDADLTFDGKRNVLIKSNAVSVDPHFGFELGFDNLLFLRGGIKNIQKVENIDASVSTIAQPSLGLGLRIKNISLDYAVSNIGQQGDIPYSHIFSLQFNIIKQKKKVADVK